MVDRRFMTIFIVVFIFSTVCLMLVWRLFLVERRMDLLGRQMDRTEESSCAYEEIDLVMPVNAFLRRCANSVNISMVRRLFVNQWISSNQQDLIKLVVYAQGATNFAELQRAFMAGIEKEGETSGAASFIKIALKTISENEKLMEHVNKSLREGFDQSIHVLRGEMMTLDKEGREYRRLKAEYRKQLDEWIDETHGELLDEIISKL